MQKETVIHLVPSSHWDREWYLPFRRFQVRLMRLFDKVRYLLEEGGYPFFLMDGQWIVLEDYLELRPEQRGWAEKMIREGRLAFGPWYTVPDTLIPSGESLVHNLRLGQQMAAQWGGGLDVGYSPDSFGLAVQLPQIYAQFGFDSAMFTRGERIDGAEREELYWSSPDGTALPALFGYYSLGVGLVLPTVWRSIDRLENDPQGALEQARAILAGENARTDLPERLWIVGIDHVEPKRSLPALVEALNGQIPGVTFRLSTMREYFDRFTAMIGSLPAPRTVGEQRGPYKEHFVLGNTAATRLDIKQLNRAAENKLALTDGTLSALWGGVNTGYERLDWEAVTALAWKLLVQNHAHDSICCCSADATVEDIRHRMTNALQLAREVEKDALAKLGASVAPGASRAAVLVYNPLPFARRGRVAARMAVPCAAPGTRLTDENGVPIPARVTELFRKRRDIETMKANEFDEIAADTTRVLLGGETETDIYTGLAVEFDAEVPACGYRCYYLDVGAAEPLPAKPHPLESDFLRVEIAADGTLTVTEKATGKVLHGTHWFELTPDDGDTYTFSPAGRTLDTRGTPAEVQYTDGGAQIRQRLAAPQGTVTLCTDVSLADGGRTLAFTARIANRAKNMRLRAVLGYPGCAACSMGDTAFDLTRRPVFAAEELEAGNITTFPMREAAALALPWGTEAVFTDSLHEYEAVNTADGCRLALTLLRSNEKIYVTKTLTRDETDCGEGTRWWSRDALMQGEYTVRYALRCYPGEKDAATAILNDAASFALPLVPYGVCAEGSAPAAAMGCSVEGAVMTGMEKDGDAALRLRVHNPLAAPAPVCIRLAAPVAAAQLLTLGGTVTQSLPVADGCVSLTLPPHRIAAVRIETA